MVALGISVSGRLDAVVADSGSLPSPRYCPEVGRPSRESPV